MMCSLPPRRRFLVLIAGTLLTLLQACGSSGPAREDSYYRLDLTSSPKPITHSYPGTLLVSKIDGRGFAGDRAIVFRDVGKLDQVQRYTYHLWAEAPPLSIQDLLARYLREARVARFVVTPTQRVRADLIISGTLFLMEHRPFDAIPEVAIDLELGVVRADRREPLFLKRYQARETTANQQIAGAIPAFERALNGIFQSFLADLEGALPELDHQHDRLPRRSGR